MLRRFLANPKVGIGLTIIGLFTLVAVLGRPFASEVLGRTPQSIFPEAMGASPSWTHPLGTTVSGQDVFTWLLYGTYNSMFVGFASAIIASAISIAMCTAAGFLGGAVDRLLNGIILIFQNMPSFPLLIIAAT